MLSGEKILITGGSGLVGRELARPLAKDNEVWCVARYAEKADRVGAINDWTIARNSIDRMGVKTFAADLTGALEGLPDDFTYVLHLAHTRLGPEGVYDAVRANTLTAARVLHHCRKAKAALVMSSTAVYSFPKDVWTKVDERADLGRAAPPFMNPTSPASKISVEAVARASAATLGLRTVVTRLNVPYGPGGGMPVRDLEHIAAGEALPHGGVGDLYPHAPIHFDDMNDQLEALLDAASTEALFVNWCGDEVVTQREWVEQAEALTGRKAIYDIKPGAPGNISDPSLRRSITGPCKTTFKDGFAEVHRIKYGDGARA